MYLIIGLGNPGSKYAGTRHNIGFEMVDYLAAKHNISLNKVKYKALYGEGHINNTKVVIAKPQTYMNLSGESVREMKEWYKVSSDNIIIVYDDISLQPGKLRVRGKGSAGGHNGIKSIIYQLNDDVFPRIKIGVGAPQHADYELADFVLGRFSKDEYPVMDSIIKTAAEAVEEIVRYDVHQAMNKFNGN